MPNPSSTPERPTVPLAGGGIIFRPELADLVLAGGKTVTRRVVVPDNPRSPWHPDMAPRLAGRRRAVIPGRGKPGVGWVTIASVQLEQPFAPASLIFDVDDHAEAKREGFVNSSAFRRVWAELHGSLQPIAAGVWRVEMTDPERKESDG